MEKRLSMNQDNNNFQISIFGLHAFQYLVNRSLDYAYINNNITVNINNFKPWKDYLLKAIVFCG